MKRKNKSKHKVNRPAPPVFKKIFINIALPVMCVFIIIGIGIIVNFYMYKQKEAEDEHTLLTQTLNIRIDNINQTYLDEAEEAGSDKELDEIYDKYMRSLIYNIGVFVHDFDTAAVIAEKNSSGKWEIICDSAKSMLMIVKDIKNERLCVYSYALEDNNRLMEFIKHYEGMDDYELRVRDIYLKEENGVKALVPGIIEVYKSKTDWHEDVIEYESVGKNESSEKEEGEVLNEYIKLVDTFDASPKNTSGYEHIKMDGINWRMVGSMVGGSEFGSNALKSLRKNYSTKLEENSYETEDGTVSYMPVEEQMTEGGELYILSSDSVELYERIDNVRTVENDITTPDGIIPLKNALLNMPSKKVYIMVETNLNIMKKYSKHILLAWLLWLFIPFVVCIIVANSYFQKSKARWEIENYRRITTNAMAHDLKSPLMILSGYAENLKENIRSDKREHYADAIIENVDYMNRLVMDILHLANTQDSEMALHKEKVSLAALAEEIRALYEAAMEKKNITMDIDGDVTLMIDRSLFSRALSNIFINAIKYSPENAHITVDIEEKCMSVQNTGVSLPAEFCRKAFDAFVKNDFARSNEQGGGVGLSIVKGILDAHQMSCEMVSGENAVTVVIYF